MWYTDEEEEWEFISTEETMKDEYEVLEQQHTQAEPGGCQMPDDVGFALEEKLQKQSGDCNGVQRDPLEQISREERDELLEDVIYSKTVSEKLYSLEKDKENPDAAKEKPFSSRSTTKLLEELFNVTNNEVSQFAAKAQARKISEIKITVNILKVQKKGFAIMHKDESSYHFKAWIFPNILNNDEISTKNKTFHLNAACSDQCFLKIKVMKKHKLKIKGLTNPENLKNLGFIQIPLKELRGTILDRIVELKSEDGTSSQNSRSVHVRVQIDLKRRHIESQFGPLLHRIVSHHLKKKEMQDAFYRWNGQLDAVPQRIVDNYLFVFNVEQSEELLYWWTICMKLPFADHTWLLELIRKVFAFFAGGVYKEEQIKVLRCSLEQWSFICLEKMNTLLTSFPLADRFASSLQMELMLRIAKIVDDFQFKGLTSGLSEEIKQAALSSVMVWWNGAGRQILEAETLKEKIKCSIQITWNIKKFLSNEVCFYDSIFNSEIGYDFLGEVRRSFIEKLKNWLTPLIECIGELVVVSRQEFVREDIDFQVSDDTWQIFVNVRDIYRLKSNSCQIETEYESWFLKYVLYWLDSSKRKSRGMIRRAMALDSLEELENVDSKSTTSALDTSCIVTRIVIWWQDLKWSDDVFFGCFLSECLQIICSCCLFYGQLLIDKISNLDNKTQPMQDFNYVTSKKVCYAVNNLEKVRQHVVAMEQMLEIQQLLSRLKKANGEVSSGSLTLECTIQNIFENFNGNIATKKRELISAAFQKVDGVIVSRFLHSMKSVKETKECKSLFLQWIDECKESVCQHHFQEFTLNLVKEFVGIVNNEVSKTKNFHKFLTILELGIRIISFHSGLETKKLKREIKDYDTVNEKLKIHTLSTEKLIERYYWERYEDQTSHHCKRSSQLVVIVFYSSMSVLNVEIVMGKDLTHSRNCSKCSGIDSKVESVDHKLIDSWVNVEIVPLTQFENCFQKRTDVVKASDPAVYEEKFVFEISPDHYHTGDGFILFTAMETKKRLLGQALIPLEQVDLIQGDMRAVPKHLTMTYPQAASEYKSLSVLMKRSKDVKAKSFLNKVNQFQ